jgi:hypothetical protein
VGGFDAGLERTLSRLSLKLAEAIGPHSTYVVDPELELAVAPNPNDGAEVGGAAAGVLLLQKTYTSKLNTLLAFRT